MNESAQQRSPGIWVEGGVGRCSHGPPGTPWGLAECVFPGDGEGRFTVLLPAGEGHDA